MDKLKPRAIIFDLGSTLIEYEPIAWDELGELGLRNGKAFLESNGITTPSESQLFAEFDRIRAPYRQEAKETLSEWTVSQVLDELVSIYAGELSKDKQGELASGFFDAYYDRIADHLFAYDDSVDTLSRFKSAGFVIGLVSNTIFPEETHHKELDRFGLAEFFDFTVFSSTEGIRKPHHDIFIKAVNLAGQAPSDCVYIGDRYVEDIQGPNDLGMNAILKRKEGRIYPDEMPLATRIISNLSELFDHIELQS